MSSQVERQTSLLLDCVKSLKSWKSLIKQHLEGEVKTAELKKLEEITKDYCRNDFNAKKVQRAAEEVVDYFNDGSNDHSVDVSELYNKYLQLDTSEMGNVEQCSIWKEVIMNLAREQDQDVEEVTEEARSEPETAFEEMHDSIYYSNVFTPPVDPISKTVIQIPYKSKSCGHVYEKKFIIQYIKSMKNKAKCPYIGCSNQNLTLQQLIKDDTTRLKIEEYQRSQIGNNEDSDDEDD